MDKVLLALGGIALGVAGYKLGEEVQKRRVESGNEEYGVVDLFEEFLDEENFNHEILRDKANNTKE